MNRYDWEGRCARELLRLRPHMGARLAYAVAAQEWVRHGKGDPIEGAARWAAARPAAAPVASSDSSDTPAPADARPAPRRARKG